MALRQVQETQMDAAFLAEHTCSLHALCPHLRFLVVYLSRSYSLPVNHTHTHFGAHVPLSVCNLKHLLI